MSQAFNWENLDLTNAEAPRVSNGLPPGRYHVKIAEAVNAPTKRGDGAGLSIEYVEEVSGGSTKEFINLFTSSTEEGKLKSVEIGRGRLKALLLAAGHPNPDKPGMFVPWLKGRRIGLIVEQGEDWRDDKGVMRKGGVKPTQRGSAYFVPNTMPVGAGVGVAPPSSGTVSSQRSTARPSTSDDDIPF